MWITGAYFIHNWYDVLPLMAGTIANLGLLKRDNREIVARASLTSQFCWITYNIIVSSWMGILCCLLVGSSCVIGMIRHENWKIGRCYRSFAPSIAKSLFIIPSWTTYP
ncbi:MAG: YgjV family protein [Alphaproteobacteria bacterium]|nr:YgjV family protein [Alphaproteobacteria bacterium]